jgi:uncharacterized protein (UPF0303 family)
MRILRSFVVLALWCSLIIAQPAAAQPEVDGEVWRNLAQKLDAGITVDVRLRNRRHFKATFIEGAPDALIIQRKTRVPVPVERIPYDSIASLSRADRMSGGKIAGIIAGTAGAVVGGLMLVFAVLASYD